MANKIIKNCFLEKPQNNKKVTPLKLKLNSKNWFSRIKKLKQTIFCEKG